MAAYIGAGIFHALLIGALLFNYNSKPKSLDADYAEKVDVVKATTVDESEIQQKQNELKQKEREEKARKDREKRELEELKKDKEKLAEDKRQEEKQLEELQKEKEKSQEEAAKLEQQRKEIALKKAQEEAKAKKEAEERAKRLAEQKRKDEKARQERLVEQKRQEEAERIRIEEQELNLRREMQERLAREQAMIAEQRAQERATTLSAKYSALIKQRVQPKISVSPEFSKSLVTQMNVKLSPSGDVRNVRIIESSGNPAYDRAVETAIYASSPLPIPSRSEDPEVNKIFQDLFLYFPNDVR